MGKRRVFWKVCQIVLFGRYRKVERSLNSYRAKRRVHWEIKPIFARKINSCSFYHVKENYLHWEKVGIVTIPTTVQQRRYRFEIAAAWVWYGIAPIWERSLPKYWDLFACRLQPSTFGTAAPPKPRLIYASRFVLQLYTRVRLLHQPSLSVEDLNHLRHAVRR